MKPIELKIQAFGPFVNEQTIDFKKLSEKGLFLIKGKTGSGKTTIFDAMTFALYGKASGSDNASGNVRDSIQEWRCNQAGDEKDTKVEFTFSEKGKTYKFVRGTRMGRKNLNDFSSCFVIDAAGNEQPLIENFTATEVTRMAEKIIGLNREQFVKVVLLPQGQFEKFLVAKSGDKESLLQQIFDSHKWEQYAVTFKANAETRKKELDHIHDEVTNSLQEDECASLDELSGKVEKLYDDKEKAENEHRNFDSAKKQEELRKDIERTEAFKPLREEEHRYKDLLTRKNEIDQKRAELRQANEAEDLRQPIKDYEDALKDKNNREKALTKYEAETKAKEGDLEKATDDCSDFEGSVDVAAENNRIGEFESKEQIYKDYGAVRDQHTKCVAAENEASSKCDIAKERFEESKNKTIGFKQNFDNADREAKEYRDRYYSGIYGEIASELKDGGKCPVCGSTAHPSPAVRTPESVTKQEVERKEKDAEAAKKKLEAADAERQAAEDELRQAETRLSTCKSDTAAAKASLQNFENNLISGINDLDALHKKIKETRANISTYEDKLRQLKETASQRKEAYDRAIESHKHAGSEYKKAEETFAAAKENLDSRLTAAGCTDYLVIKGRLMDNKDRDELNRYINTYETEVNALFKSIEEKKAALAGQTEPDASRFGERQKEINDEGHKYAAEIGRIESEISRLQRKQDELSKKEKTYLGNIKEAEADCAFARTLKGDTGIGLSRYVLAIMFDQVIGEANRMLKLIHGGRYQIFRTDDRVKGNQRGLELKVYDNRAPEKDGGRGVGSLSGGEKFLVSLALSIGLSMVAQKSGVRIESLFIDEGFGTLDDSSIDDALEVLENVRKGSGTIGIISHVKILEENIPTQLEVIDEKGGNLIKAV